MYADDLVECMMEIVKNSSPSCPIYNVGSDEAILIGELAQIVAHEFGQVASVPIISKTRVDRYVPENVKIRKDLGINLKYDLPSAIRETVKVIRNRDTL